MCVSITLFEGSIRQLIVVKFIFHPVVSLTSPASLYDIESMCMIALIKCVTLNIQWEIKIKNPLRPQTKITSAIS